MTILKTQQKRTYLTFQFENENFAVDVANVHEVLEFTSATKVPAVPDFIRGIINLRGQVVPVFDLRSKFSMGETVRSDSTCVVVLDIGTGDNQTDIGTLADSVKEVFEFEQGQIEPPPPIATLSQFDFIQGIGKRDTEFIIILNVNRVFSTDEVVLLGATAEEDIMMEDVDLADQEEKKVS